MEHKYEKIIQIGTGQFGQVYLVKSKTSGRHYAMKRNHLQLVIRQHKLYQLILQKQIHKSIAHPVIIFMSTISYNYAKEGNQKDQFVKGVHLLQVNQKQCIFIAAQLINVLQYLSFKKVVHRDIKGHIKLCDFGVSFCFNENIIKDQKQNILRQKFRQYRIKQMRNIYFTRQRRSSFVGSPHYFSPQLLLNQKCQQSADLWAFGVLLYYMLTGQHLFSGQTADQIQRNILNFNNQIQNNRLSDRARSLLKYILNKNPQQRISCSQIKKHKLFEGIDFNKVFNEISPIKQRTQKFRLNMMNRCSIFEDGILQNPGRMTSAQLRQIRCICEQRGQRQRQMNVNAE